MEDSCLERPCENGATCHNIVNGDYTCECVYGYQGDRCETGKRYDNKIILVYLNL